MGRRRIAQAGRWRETTLWRRSLTIPPDSLDTWLNLAFWEIWMGVMIAVMLGFGVGLIGSAPDRIIAITDLSGCYQVPPLPAPCDRTIYRGGMLNMAFSALAGIVFIAAALWLLWELWDATMPRPITDDFLRLLDDSFGRSWRNPLTWPWARVGWAYGFTALGAALAVTIALITSRVFTSLTKPLSPKVDTSQSFRAPR